MGTPVLAGHVGRALGMDSRGMSAACPGADSSFRLLCVAVGQLDRPSDLADDGYDSGHVYVQSCTWLGTWLWVPRGDGWAVRGALEEQCQEGLQHRESALPAPLPELSCTSPLPWAWEGEWTCVHALTLLWKEDSVAEHQGKGGGCSVHVLRVSATARGE